jgi:RNA polymerase sigma-70 factor (ECF subfamily)
MNDSTAIKKCSGGEMEAFRVLVERYQNQAAAHATAILRNREDALDAVQEAFIDAFRSLKSYDHDRPFYPWFYVMLRNRCYKMAGRRREADSIEEIDILAPQIGLQNEERLALEKALHSLTDADREIVTLKYLDGLSYEELAEHLQIPRGTVMSRLFHARRHLQAKLTAKFNK